MTKPWYFVAVKHLWLPVCSRLLKTILMLCWGLCSLWNSSEEILDMSSSWLRHVCVITTMIIGLYNHGRLCGIQDSGWNLPFSLCLSEWEVSIIYRGPLQGSKCQQEVLPVCTTQHLWDTILSLRQALALILDMPQRVCFLGVQPANVWGFYAFALTLGFFPRKKAIPIGGWCTCV